MRIRSGSSFAHKMTWMALVTSGIASATLMATFLAYDLISAHIQMQSHLDTLAEVVGQNSTAALLFDDKPAAREMLEAFRTESPIVTACLYSPAGISSQNICASQQCDSVRNRQENGRRPAPLPLQRAGWTGKEISQEPFTSNPTSGTCGRSGFISVVSLADCSSWP